MVKELAPCFRVDSPRLASFLSAPDRSISPSIPNFSSPHQEIVEVLPGRFLGLKHLLPKGQFGSLGYTVLSSSSTRSAAQRNNRFSGQGDLIHPNAVGGAEDERIYEKISSDPKSKDRRESVTILNGNIGNGDVHDSRPLQDHKSYQRLQSSGQVSRVATASNVSVLIKPSASAVTRHDIGDHTSADVRHKPSLKHRESQLSLITVANVQSASLNSNGHLIKGSNCSDAGAKAVIFFIHGVGGSADVWQAQMDYFADHGYEVIAPDLIGHGFSNSPHRPSAYTFSAIATDLFLIFDKFKKRKNIVVGHSYGSCFATVLAHRRPRHVDRLILISGGGPTPLYPQPGIFSMPSCILSCIRPVLTSAFKKSAFHGETKTLVPREKAFDVPTYVLKYTMNGQNWLEGDAEFHQTLLVPTLLLYGERDGLVSLDEEQEMEKTIHGSRLVVIRDASHMVMMERPAQVNLIMHEFIDPSNQPANQQQGILTTSNHSLDNLSVQDLS